MGHGGDAKDGWEWRHRRAKGRVGAAMMQKSWGGGWGAEDVGFHPDTLRSHRCSIGDVLMKHARDTVEM